MARIVRSVAAAAQAAVEHVPRFPEPVAEVAGRVAALGTAAAPPLGERLRRHCRRPARWHVLLPTLATLLIPLGDVALLLVAICDVTQTIDVSTAVRIEIVLAVLCHNGVI